MIPAMTGEPVYVYARSAEGTLGPELSFPMQVVGIELSASIDNVEYIRLKLLADESTHAASLDALDVLYERTEAESKQTSV